MKKALSLLLCLCLLVGAAACLTSCQKKPQSIDLTDYRLIYESSYKTVYTAWTKNFASQLGEYTGYNVKTVTDAAAGTSEKEILLGVTNRPESSQLFAKIKGDGYAYSVINGKLVLIGTNKLMTLMAVKAFMEDCLTGEGGAIVNVRETVVSNAPTVQLTGSYSVVYSQYLDDDKNTGGRESEAYVGENPDGLDHAVVMANQVRETMKDYITTTSTSLQLETDKKEATSREVLIGLVNREATKSFIKTIDINSYGVALYDQTVVITGLNDNGLRQAVEMFNQLAELGATTNAEGKKVIEWPAGLTMVSSKNFGWETDVPLPEGEGIELSGSVDVAEGSVEFYYTGSGINAEAFNSYCAGMADAGYVLLQENTMEDSIFRTYRNESTHVLLYTAYAAFKHAAEQNVKLYEPCIRVVTSSTHDAGSEFDQEIFTPNYGGYTKVTDTRLTAVRLGYKADNSIYGNCYVIQLEDGSFIVQDGGFTGSKDYDRLYAVLSDLHFQAFGRKPTQANPITIAAWYLSHGHGDHYGNFTAMCQNYGSTIKTELLIANQASDLENYNCLDPNTYVRNNLSVISGYTQGDMKYLKVHTGMVLYIRNVEIEVLYTHEDIYPQTFSYFNNSSTVLRTTLHVTDGQGNLQNDENATTVLWLGDLQTRGSACLRAMYGSYMESDIVQIAHHGGNGSESELYALTKATILLWPCSAAQMKSRSGNPYADRGTASYVSYRAYHMESVVYNIASDTYNTTITFTKDGYNMDVGGVNGLYNAGESAAIVVSNKDGAAIVKMK